MLNIKWTVILLVDANANARYLLICCACYKELSIDALQFVVIEHHKRVLRKL